MEEEIWKDVEGWEGFYQVSNFGNIKSLERIVYKNDNSVLRVQKEKILCFCLRNNKYRTIYLHRNNDIKCFQVHRLVALTFIPNPENKPCVNHIDGDKLNNHVSNLEWCTQSENVTHAYRNGLKIHNFLGKFGDDHHRSKAVLQFKIDGTFVCRFGSTKEADRNTGIDHRNIANVAQGRVRSAGGFMWKYEQDFNINTQLN